MKIGIITFHWATNYGAVLQAYALQSYLSEQGHDVEIINYRPLRNIILQRMTWIKNLSFGSFAKERKLKRFRRENLITSKKVYSSNKALLKANNVYDVIICGSDQVWNMSFIQYAEKNKQTFSYYLDFLNDKTKKVAYAASFGTNEITARFKSKIKECLSDFESISVRENSAKKMLCDIGIESKIVVDPTLLLQANNYYFLPNNSKKWHDLFVYRLHKNQCLFDKVESYLTSTINSVKTSKNMSIEDWLQSIKNSNFVLTNSFHGVVFSIIFRVPFLSVLVEGSDMNDRILTLLSSVGLQERCINEFDNDIIDKIMKTPILWEDVLDKLMKLKEEAKDFLSSAIVDRK